jgi:hypothetical protein
LEENIGAVELKLTSEEVKACDEVWAGLRPPRIFYGRQKFPRNITDSIKGYVFV